MFFSSQEAACNYDKHLTTATL